MDSSKQPRRRSGRPPRKPAKRYHHGHLREALLDAAVALISTSGPDTLTLRAAARKAGVSQAAPYRHFRDKRTLLAAVATRGFTTLTAALRAASGKGADPLDRFQAVGTEYLSFAKANGAYYRVMFGPELAERESFPALRQAAGEAFAVLEESVKECQLAGIVRQGDSLEFALAAWCMVHGIAQLMLDHQLDRFQRTGASDLKAHLLTDLFLGLAQEGGKSGRN